MISLPVSEEVQEALLDLERKPLPEEQYPRDIPKRTPEAGYYIALAVCLSVWIITPGCW